MLVDTSFALLGVETEEIFDMNQRWSRGISTEDPISDIFRSEILLFFLLYLAFPPSIFIVRIIYKNICGAEPDLRDIKFKYLVLILTDFLDMLVAVLKTILGFACSNLVAVCCRASPNLVR